MSLLDLILLAILGLSIASGFIAGFAKSSIGFLASIIGMISAFWLYGIPGAWIEQYIAIHWLASALGFCAILMFFSLLGSIVGRLLAKVFKWTGLAWLDRLLGACFGAVRGAAAASAVVAVLMAVTPRPTPAWMSGSFTVPWFLGASHVFEIGRAHV